MPTKPLASQPCTCKDSFTLNTIDNEVKELLESCQKLTIKPNLPLKPAYETGLHIKVENVLKGSLDSIPSPSVKIQIIGWKVCLIIEVIRGCFAFTPQAKFPAHNLIFTEGAADGIESRLPFKIFSTFIQSLVS